MLDSLRAQTIPPSRWDFVLVDNNSSPPLQDSVELGWHPRGRVLVETTQGKMYAIAAVFRETQTDLIMFLDDDEHGRPARHASLSQRP